MVAKSTAAKVTKTKRTGRPPKPPETVATHLMTVRLNDDDKAMLDALVARERARLEAAGSMETVAARVAAADVLRALIRQETKRQGLSSAA